MPHLTVDLRLLHASGIGRYLAQTVPDIARAVDHTSLLCRPADRAEAENLLQPSSAVSILDCRAPIYSIAEQVEIPARVPRGTDLFWSPHYNVPLAYRGKMLVTIHDALHLARPEFVRRRLQRIYARVMFRSAVRRPEIVLCDSSFTASELMRHAGADSRKLRVVHLGVDESWFEVPGEEWRGSGPPYLLFVGNLKPHKNVSGLLKAFERVREKLPHDLVIVGKREGFITGDPGVAELAAQMGDRVRFAGTVVDAELKRLVAGATALVLPSLYEGFGLPPLEAMAAGCPAIVSRAGSLPEVCGDAALYCDPYDPGDIAGQIERLVESETLQREMREKGIERAREFPWWRCIEQTSEAVAEALR